MKAGLLKMAADRDLNLRPNRRIAVIVPKRDEQFVSDPSRSNYNQLWKPWPWQGRKLLEGPGAELVFVILPSAGKELMLFSGARVRSSPDG